MIKVELELEDSFVEQAEHQAAIQHTTVEALFADLLKQQLPIPPTPNRTLGLFADEPKMIDEMMEMIRAEREKTSPNTDTYSEVVKKKNLQVKVKAEAY